MSLTSASAGAAARTLGHARLAGQRRLVQVARALHLSRLLTIVPPLLGLVAIAALVLAIDPTTFRRAVANLTLAWLPPIVAVSALYYVLQGVRWHLLLAAVGIRLRLRDTVLLNAAGQATAVLPLGELTRAVLVSDAADADFGEVVATVTVQELIYTMILIAFAVPGLVAIPHALGGVIAALVITMSIFVGLAWCPAYAWLRRGVAHTPLLRRLSSEVDSLHNDVVVLMRHRGTFGWSWITAMQAAASIGVFWMVAQAIDPGALGWRQAAYVYAVSNLAGALSLIPGGIGAYEASVVGLLAGVGINPGVAAAIAVIHRLADKGLATAIGFVAYGVARRSLHVSGLGALPHHRPAVAEAGMVS